MKWLKVTSVYDTYLYIRAEWVVYIEGFDFGADHKFHPGHRGCRIELQGG